MTLHTASRPALSKHPGSDENRIRLLQIEIAGLERDLVNTESGIRALESRIRFSYAVEIARIRELGLLYKKQKQNKKANRREQKKRGVNYHEPVNLKKKADRTKYSLERPTGDTQERKRLYREAVRLVHPDKFINHPPETGTRSQELTIQLIDTYQNGDIHTLRHLYRHIVSGNAMAPCNNTDRGVPDPHVLIAFLAAKRDELSAALVEAQQSRLHEVLATYDDPQKFIDGLAMELGARIVQLERRTRTRT